MATASASIDLPVSADKVWQLIGGFGSLPEWNSRLPGPNVETSPESGRSAEAIIAPAKTQLTETSNQSAATGQQHGTAGRRLIDRTQELGRETRLDRHTNRCRLIGRAITRANKA